MNITSDTDRGQGFKELDQTRATTAADLVGRIEIRHDRAADMFEVYNVQTGEVYTREQTDYDARVWRSRRFTEPSETRYCQDCLAEDLFTVNCQRHDIEHETELINAMEAELQ